MLDLIRNVEKRFLIFIWIVGLILGSRPRSVCGFRGRLF
jgi:hypothetical protein